MDPMNDVRGFHEAFGIPVTQRPEFPGASRRALRQDLITEEVNELALAEFKHDLVAVADAIADCIYILCGTALEYGIPMAEVWREVHRSNMANAACTGAHAGARTGRC